MGNNPSSDNPCHAKQTASPNEPEAIASIQEKDSKKTDQGKKIQTTAMALSKAGVIDLKKIGIRAEIAEKLVQGTLKSLSDVVAVLEKTGARCEVQFEDNFKVQMDEMGEIELQCREKDREKEPAKKKMKGWIRWPSSATKDDEGSTVEDQTDDVEPAAKKSRSFKRKWQSQKRRKVIDDEDFEEEEWDDNEEKIDVNTASKDELESVQGLGPSLARKIIKYREEHGVFRRLEDLSAVRGVSKRLVKKLDDVLGVGDVESEEEDSYFKINSVPPTGCLQYEGREVIRIMSWNLQCFNDDKAANEGVVEVICRSILENG
jgi:competence ComEA-like helix-hairpin-helix protein